MFLACSNQQQPQCCSIQVRMKCTLRVRPVGACPGWHALAIQQQVEVSGSNSGVQHDEVRQCAGVAPW